MKRLVRFFTNDRLWQMVVALFLAVTLFFTAWSGNTQNKNNSSIASNTFTKTVESVPVDIKYDSDKYFISGYSYDAEVYLTATTQLALTTETTSDTRHFKLLQIYQILAQGQVMFLFRLRIYGWNVCPSITFDLDSNYR